MTSQTVRRIIDSLVATAFDTVAHIENFAKAVPHIVRSDVVSDVKPGAGTKFRETRLMNGGEVTQELEVTETSQISEFVSSVTLVGLCGTHFSRPQRLMVGLYWN